MELAGLVEGQRAGHFKLGIKALTANASIVQPSHAATKSSSQGTPMFLPSAVLTPFETAGETSLTFPANCSISLFQSSAA